MTSRGRKILELLKEVEEAKEQVPKDQSPSFPKNQQQGTIVEVREEKQDCMAVEDVINFEPEINYGPSAFSAESDNEPYSPDHSEYAPSSPSSESDTETENRNNTKNTKINKKTDVPKNAAEMAKRNVTLDSAMGNRKLEGMEEFPTRTDKPRKRIKDPTNWSRNVSKRRKLRGENYVSSKGKFVPGTSLKDPCPPTCRRRCSEKISEDERLNIFQNYYHLDSYERQRDFIHSNTEKHKKKCTTKQNSKRDSTILFFLPKSDRKLQVCKKMFISTLGIRKGIVDIAMKKRTEGNVSSSDRRGKHVKRATSAEVLQAIRNHIEKFPVMASHYCRENTQRKYLYPDLNITIMYEMYRKECEQRNTETGSGAMYRKVFCEEYNLGFFRPRKDQCRLCMTYNTPGTDQNSLETDYQAHIAAKNRARQEKISDKENAAMSDGKILCCNFDLQQVLLVPSDKSNNALFYVQRLKTYNFTIYNTVSHQGDCFIWSEVEGKRGSCEIATFLYSYIKSLPDTVEHIVCYSDRCGGQNLNKFVAAMCLKVVQEVPHLKEIDLKFLVKGHSEMECDSIHAAIGTEFKRVGKVNIPSDWKTIARSARRKGDKPYIVHDIVHKNILNWKKHAGRFIFRKEDTSRNAVHWQKMSWLNFSKNLPNVIRFKENFDDEFRQLNCQRKTRTTSATFLEPLYLGQLSLKKEKYNALVSLFQMKPPALAVEFQPFYQNLPCQGAKRNRGIEVSSDSDVGSD